MTSIDFSSVNEQLSNASAEDIIQWAAAQAKKPLVSTNFGPHEAVILHMVTQLNPETTVLWVDSGYNTRDTYKVAQQLIERLNLNIKVYAPTVTAARRDAALGGIPTVDDPGHAEFTEQFKLEPFKRGMDELKPDVWFTAVRREQTAFRQDMAAVSEGPNGVIKVAPLLDWTTEQMDDYLKRHDLPNVEKYFDPTKAVAGRECGLHTQL